MEQQLEDIKEFFPDIPFRISIDDILESYLQRQQCSFSTYQKKAFPICAAYYAICEARETVKQESESLAIADNSSTSQFQLPTIQYKTSLMELRNHFYKRADFEQIIVTMCDFASKMKDRIHSECISIYLDTLKRQYRLFLKCLNVIFRFVDASLRVIFTKLIWRFYLLLKEAINCDEDIEKCAYLLHFVCTYTFDCYRRGDIALQYRAGAAHLSEQVNALLLKNKLDSELIEKLEPEFNKAIELLYRNIQHKYQQSNASDTSDSFEREEPLPPFAELLSDAQSSSLIRLCNILEQETHSLKHIEETQFFTPSSDKVDSQKQILTQPPTATYSQQYNFDISQNAEETKHSNTSFDQFQQYPTVSNSSPPAAFYEDSNKLNTTVRLNNNHGASPPSPANPQQHQMQQNQMKFNQQFNSGQKEQQQQYPKQQLQQQQQQNHQFNNKQMQNYQTPIQYNAANHNTQTHSPMLMVNGQRSPSSPESVVLDNYKWMNVYTKQEPSKRLDELMAKIGKEYKETIYEKITEIAKDVYFNSRKKTENSGSQKIPSLTASQSQTEMQTKVVKTINLFTNVLEKMICDEDSRNCKEEMLLQLIGNRDFIFALLANCFMTISFIREIKGVSLEYLLCQCEITSIDFWRVISNFAKFDRHMPESIRENLFNTEKQILLYNIWEEKDQTIQNALIQSSSPDPIGQTYDRVICRRLFNHCATRVQEFALLLELEDEISERIWDALQHILKNEIHLMNNHYIDQILLCTIYALQFTKPELFVGKEIKFKTMISTCQNLIHFNAEKVKKTTGPNNEPIEIIPFYNKQYLISMKPYLKTQFLVEDPRYSSPQSIFAASLANSIPLVFIQYTRTLRESYFNTNNTTSPMSPQQQQISTIAHSRSPNPDNSVTQHSMYLKQQHQNIQNNSYDNPQSSSKQLIPDYDEESQRTSSLNSRSIPTHLKQRQYRYNEQPQHDFFGRQQGRTGHSLLDSEETKEALLQEPTDSPKFGVILERDSFPIGFSLKLD